MISNSIPNEIMDTILGELKIGLTLVDNTEKIIYFNQLASELLAGTIIFQKTTFYPVIKKRLRIK